MSIPLSPEQLSKARIYSGDEVRALFGENIEDVSGETEWDKENQRIQEAKLGYNRGGLTHEGIDQRNDQMVAAKASASRHAIRQAINDAVQDLNETLEGLFEERDDLHKERNSIFKEMGQRAVRREEIDTRLKEIEGGLEAAQEKKLENQDEIQAAEDEVAELESDIALKALEEERIVQSIISADNPEVVQRKTEELHDCNEAKLALEQKLAIAEIKRNGLQEFGERVTEQIETLQTEKAQLEAERKGLDTLDEQAKLRLSEIDDRLIEIDDRIEQTQSDIAFFKEHGVDVETSYGLDTIKEGLSPESFDSFMLIMQSKHQQSEYEAAAGINAGEPAVTGTDEASLIDSASELVSDAADTVSTLASDAYDYVSSFWQSEDLDVAATDASNDAPDTPETSNTSNMSTRVVGSSTEGHICTATHGIAANGFQNAASLDSNLTPISGTSLMQQLQQSQPVNMSTVDMDAARARFSSPAPVS